VLALDATGHLALDPGNGKPYSRTSLPPQSKRARKCKAFPRQHRVALLKALNENAELREAMRGAERIMGRDGVREMLKSVVSELRVVRRSDRTRKSSS
jgi:hypothetical protein